MRVLPLLAFVAIVAADLYLHNPRGSNNRLDERNRNRDNANRLFDSQNNNKGGYNQNDMYYYEGSIMQVEWTNQHSCGNENNNCELIFQYMCENGNTGAGIRDGDTSTTITTAAPNSVKYGRHETGAYYTECSIRQRNKGLFLADQTLQGDTAIYTRQNTNGARYGFECPEEREYYPYWHPAPWVDVAILTGDTARCPFYLNNSQNTNAKGHCKGVLAGSTNAAAGTITDGRYYNNQKDCQGAGFTWMYDSILMDLKGNKLNPPACRQSPWSRDNHLGNGVQGYANTFDWAVPMTDGSDLATCVFRARYNISTDDYDGWNTYSNLNGANSPIQDNPTVSIGTVGGVATSLTLALNTDQYGRTFEDRSSKFYIKPRGSGVSKGDVIYNLNVKGQRGNIVQNYPSVEYDFSPSVLTVTPSDCIHRQVSGSNNTPAGAGQGRESTDRSNFVEIKKPSLNYPRYLNDITMIKDPMSDTGFATVKAWALQYQNDGELDDARPYFDFGVVCGNNVGAYNYMSCRTNNFTNRSQKGVINVVNSNALSTGAIVGIVFASAAVVGAPSATVAYGVVFPDSAIGHGLSGVKGVFGGMGGGHAAAAAVPQGYA